MFDFHEAFEQLPLVAILRGIPAESAEEIGDALFESGFRILEVPLNEEASAVAALRRLVAEFSDRMAIGAGTVTSVEQVKRVAEIGTGFIVSPDTNPDVVEATRFRGLVSCPGVATPSEAFSAIRSGASIIKLFPASLWSPSSLRGLVEVLPTSTSILPVGGIHPPDVAGWRKAGAAGLGLGGALYRPGRSSEEVRRSASDFVEAWAAVREGAQRP